MAKRNYHREVIELMEANKYDGVKIAWWIAKHYPSVFVKGCEALENAPILPKTIIRVTTQNNLEAIRALRNAGLGLKEARDIVVDQIPNGQYYKLPANIDTKPLEQSFAII